jgi:O-antigen ligase
MTQIKLGTRQNQIITRPLAITPGIYRALAIVMGVLVLGVLASALYLAPQPATQGLVFLGLGVPIALLIWHRPEFGLLALIFLAGSFIQAADIVDLRLPIGGGMDLRDLALIGLFGLVGLRELTRGTLNVPWWSVGGPLLLFLIMAVFSAFYAIVIEHAGANWALGDLRILSLYLTFFITLWSIKRPEQLKILLLGLFIIADLTTVIVYLQQFLGADNPLLQAMLTARDWRVYQQAGAVRVVPAGQVLMHFMWFVALGVLVFGRSNRRLRAFCVVQLLFLGGGHLFTYMRAQWVALIIGVGLVFIILLPRYKQHLAKAAIIACCVALLFAGITAVGPLPKVPATPFLAGITQRFASVLTVSETEETGSLQWRNFENEQAMQAIRNQPLTGVGLGNRYRAVTTFQGEADGLLTQGSIATDRVSRFTRYVHNSYLSIAVKMGIPGLLVLLWFCAAALFKGFQVYRNLPDSEYKGVVLGILVGFAGLLEWCYFHAHLIKAESTATIGLMLALVGSIAYIYGRGSASRPIQDRSLPAKE